MNRRRKFILAVGVALGLAILIPVIHHYQLRTATEHYIAELKARGEPMELAQVVPAPVSPAKNGAPVFLKAALLLSTNQDVLHDNPPPAMRMVAPGKAMVGWAQSDVHDEDATNSWEEIQKILGKDREALNLVGLITNYPQFDFDLQYTQRFQMRLTHLGLEKRMAQKLSADSVYQLHLGDTPGAVKNVRTLLALVNGTYDERIAISQLVRIAIANIGAATTWEILQSPRLTEDQLADLQADWSRVEFIDATLNVFPVERADGEISLVKWRGSDSELQKYLDLTRQARNSLGLPDEEDSIWEKAEIKTQIFLWRYWWSYPDELQTLKGYDVLMNTIRLVKNNDSFQNALSVQATGLDKLGISKLSSSLDALYSSEPDFHYLFSSSIVTLANVVRKVMQIEVAKQTIVTAIALKRYQLKHGDYPPDLDSLVPNFLPSVPLDPVDGKPLRYRRNTDGTFLLYSVGLDGKDDGGDVSSAKGIAGSFYWLNDHVHDWVWPQPATPTEIQRYFDAQHK